jgi:hypothetical protein
LPAWLFFAEALRLDRDGDVALPLGRDARFRPAGRLVAVVTVHPRLPAESAYLWDTFHLEHGTHLEHGAADPLRLPCGTGPCSCPCRPVPAGPGQTVTMTGTIIGR